MKRIATAFSLGAIALAGIAASATIITKYKSAPVLTLHTPAKPDSTEKENPFSADMLLQSRPEIPLSCLRNMTADWTTMTADTAGNLSLLKAAEKPLLHTFSSRLRASRFAKGKLVLTTNARGDISVNGQSIAKKSNTDSVPTAASGELTLNPEADYEIQVNILSMPDDSITPEFKLEYIPEERFKEVAIEEGAEISRRFSTRGTMTGNRVSSTSLSPDGKYMLVKYYERFSQTDNVRRTELIETRTGNVISHDLPGSARWMQNSNTICYTGSAYKGYTLWSMDVPSLKTEVLANNIPDEDFYLSPNSDYIIYYKKVDGTKDAGPMKRIQDPDDRMPGNRDRYYLMRYDFKSGAEIPLTYGGASTVINDISRDGKKLLFTTSVMEPAKYPLYFNDLIQMDMNTFECDTIIRRDPYINSAVYSPDGKQLFILGSPNAFNRIGWNSGDHEIANDFDTQGFLYTIADGKVTAVTKDFDPTLQSGIIWNAVDNNIYFRGECGFGINIYRLNPKTLDIKKLDAEIPSVYNISVGDKESQWLSYNGGSFYNAGVAYLMDLKTGKSRLVADPMQADLKDVEFGKMEEWNFTAADGTEINGYMCLPPEFDPAKKYPLIVYYYGGTSPSDASIHHPYSPQVFASRDYVVYVLNPSGATGYGQEFSARHVNAWGKRTAEEIIEGVKKFCDTHEFVDKSKIGCLGASYGGFMTQYLQTLTDIFAAAVSHAGISNVTSYWGEGYWGYSYNSVAAAKSYPWNNPDLFTKQGSLFNADKIHTPLLLLHGTEDTNVPIGESIQLFNALRLLGRTVEFITVEGENHVISDFDKKLIWQDTIMAWFAKYLQNDPSWWEELYGKQ